MGHRDGFLASVPACVASGLHDEILGGGAPYVFPRQIWVAARRALRSWLVRLCSCTKTVGKLNALHKSMFMHSRCFCRHIYSVCLQCSLVAHALMFSW